MAKSQPYYYEDGLFQMELNLQNVRRELVNMIDDHQFSDCFTCNRLKCCCSTVSNHSSPSTSVSIPSSDSAFPVECDRTSSEDVIYNSAPPAVMLPTPKWPETNTEEGENSTNKSSTTNEPTISNAEKETIASLNNWIRASIPYANLSPTRVTFPVPEKVLEEINYSWPAFPKSIWSKEMLKETTLRERILCCEPNENINGSVSAFFKHFQNPAVPKT